MKTKLIFIGLLMYTSSLVAQQQLAFKYDVLGFNRQFYLATEYLLSSFVGVELGVLHHNGEITLTEPRLVPFSTDPLEVHAYAFNTLSILGDIRLYPFTSKNERYTVFGGFSFAYAHMSHIDKAYYSDFRKIRNAEPLNISNYYPQFRMGLQAGMKIDLLPGLKVEPMIRHLRPFSKKIPFGFVDKKVVGNVFYFHIKLMYQMDIGDQ